MFLFLAGYYPIAGNGGMIACDFLKFASMSTKNSSFIAVVILVLAACAQQTSSDGGPASVDISSSAETGFPVAPVSADSAMSANSLSLLDKVFDPEMLDVDLAYFEQIAGIPRRTNGESREYRIDNCDVTVSLAQERVRHMRLGLKDGCSFDLNRFLPGYGLPPISQLTFGAFGDVVGLNGVWYADCLSGCGNAYEPAVYLDWAAPRVNSFITVQLEGEAMNGGEWRMAMEHVNGNDWVMERRFNCFNEALKYRDIAYKEYAEKKPIAVTVGWNVPVPECPAE